jgi:hypothetical protein
MRSGGRAPTHLHWERIPRGNMPAMRMLKFIRAVQASCFMVRPEVALAQGLVERLAPLLPEPVVLQAKGSVVRASCPNGLWVEKDQA